MSQSLHIVEGRGLSGREGDASLDLYRITDRCTASGNLLSRKSANPEEKKGFQKPAQTYQSGHSSVSSSQVQSQNRPVETSRFLDGKERPVECPSPVLFRHSQLDSVTGEVTEPKIERKSCNRKSCPVCGPKLRKRLVGHFANIFVPLSRLAFLTLTLDPKCGVSAKDSRKYILYAWSRFRKRMHRKGEFVFLAALESHKSGYTHLHVLCSLPEQASEEDVRSAWFAVGGGVVMDVQHITEEPAKVVGYVVKYIFKDAQEAAGRRSMLCSKGISYYGEEHRERRKEYAREARKKEGKVDAKEVTEYWEPMTHGTPGASDDTPTREDIARFREMASSLKRSTLYVHEREGRQALTYYDVQAGEIRTKELDDGLTRSMLSREIGRIRAQQSVP